MHAHSEQPTNRLHMVAPVPRPIPRSCLDLYRGRASAYITEVRAPVQLWTVYGCSRRKVNGVDD